MRIESATSPATSRAAFLGENWVMYAAAPCDYEMSEMVAPGVVMSLSRREMTIHVEGSATLGATSVLHAAGAWSAARADAALVLYLDPLGPGRAVQRLSRGGVVPWCGAEAPPADALLRLDPDLAAVADWVRDLSRSIERVEPRPMALPPRVHRTALALEGMVSGRLSLGAIATREGVSTDHLRQSFRDAVGMTLSRYLMCRRLHRFLCVLADYRRRPRALSLDALLQDAGFYDTPHAARTFRRFLAISPSMVISPALSIHDCRPDIC